MDRLAADLAQRRVAAAEHEHGPAPALDLKRRRRRGGHRGMTGRRVGHPRPQLQRLGRGRGEPELDPDLGVQGLAVGEQHPVEPPRLRLSRRLDDAVREGEGVKPEVDVRIIALGRPRRAGLKHSADGRLDPAVRELLEGANFVSLATLMGDGAPHATTVWATVEDGRPCFFTQPALVKARNVARDPRVAITVVDRENPYRSGQLRGAVTEVVEGDAARDHRPDIAQVHRRRLPDALGHRLPDRGFVLAADRAAVCGHLGRAAAVPTARPSAHLARMPT